MSNTKMNELFSILLEETSTYENLGELARGKQKALVDGDTVEINRFSSMENALLKRAEKLTGLRTLLLARLMPEEGEKKLNTLNDFIQYHDLTRQPEWLSMKERLETAVNTLKRLTYENTMLIHTSLSLMQDLVAYCYPESGQEYALYTREGVSKTPGRTVVNYGA